MKGTRMDDALPEGPAWSFVVSDNLGKACKPVTEAPLTGSSQVLTTLPSRQQMSSRSFTASTVSDPSASTNPAGAGEQTVPFSLEPFSISVVFVPNISGGFNDRQVLMSNDKIALFVSPAAEGGAAPLKGPSASTICTQDEWGSRVIDVTCQSSSNFVVGNASLRHDGLRKS